MTAGDEPPCAFARALLARQLDCECATRVAQGEMLRVTCSRPVAHHNCRTLWRLAYERARFALRLPAEGQPLAHAQALRLQCGTLQALRERIDPDASDVHRLVAAARERSGSLAELPWEALVPALAAWQLPRRRGTSP